MRVLVPIKRVIDYQVKIRVLQNNKGVDQSGVKMSMNPFCEIAVEQAVQMKEKKLIEEVSVITIGPKESESVLRTALAIGADKAIHIQTSQSIDQEIQPIHVSKILSQIIKEKQFDCCILGKQSIDDDYNQTGQMLSQLTNWPMSTFLASLQQQDDKFQVEKEIDGGIQKLLIQKNCILTCDLRLNTPRYPKLPMMMKAKKQPIQKSDIQDFDLKNIKHIEVVKVTEPPKRKGGIKVENVDELLDKLRNEAKLL